MSQAVGVERSRAGWALPQLAGMVGNVLEWYDFAAYGFLAATFAANFFPLENHLLSLVASYAVFAVAFVTRPLGGLLFGHIGDRIGRRMALLISVLAMAVPSFAIGLLPSYAGIGVLAPILLILLRMIQGVSIGGELTVSIVYLGERSTDRRRGINASLSFVGAVVGTLIGSLLISTLDDALGAEAMRAWGWRIPFLGSAVLGALGFALRIARLEEAAEPVSRSGRAPVIVAFVTEWRAMIVAFLISIPAGAAYYVGFIYLVTFAQQYDAMPAAQANLVATGGLVTLLFGVPLAAVPVGPGGPPAGDAGGRNRPGAAGVAAVRDRHRSSSLATARLGGPVRHRAVAGEWADAGDARGTVPRRRTLHRFLDQLQCGDDAAGRHGTDDRGVSDRGQRRPHGAGLVCHRDLDRRRYRHPGGTRTRAQRADVSGARTVRFSRARRRTSGRRAPPRRADGAQLGRSGPPASRSASARRYPPRRGCRAAP